MSKSKSTSESQGTGTAAEADSEIAVAPVTSSRGRISPIWIVPIVAAALGIWLAVQHYASKGPLATVRFQSAAGVTPGKTSVQRRSVEIGVVETVRLSEDHDEVVMDLRIDADAADLLREDTRFWIVRPRVNGGGISGLGTIVTGSYIELDPGLSKMKKRNFTGMETPPATPQDVPGLRLKLISDEAGSLDQGSSINYKGIKVGRIEKRTFVSTDDQVVFDVFIEEAYRHLVAGSTRFWNTAGIELELGSDGIQLRTGTLESMLTGGVEFETLDTGQAIELATSGQEFTLYDSRQRVEESLVSLKPKLNYLLMFEDSVRGLSIEAPVEFRGIRVGKVVGISFDYAPGDPRRRIPVLIQVDPTALSVESVATKEEGAARIAERVQEGLRATLKTGSILTGQLFVNLTLDSDAPLAEVGMLGDYRTLPTESAGLARLEDKIVLFIDKLQKLPLEETVAGATNALAEIEDASKSLREAAVQVDALLASEDVQNLPQRIDEALDNFNTVLAGLEPDSVLYQNLSKTTEELRDSLRSIKVLVDGIERKPNSLIFGRGGGKIDPPRAKP
jgi:paraquat-inducible protein B